jgi:hypothetical protein
MMIMLGDECLYWSILYDLLDASQCVDHRDRIWFKSLKKTLSGGVKLVLP